MSIPTLAAVPLAASLPPQLADLAALAANLRWAWKPEVQSLFYRLDPPRWLQGEGPVAILRAHRGDLDPAVAAEAARARQELDAYLAAAHPPRQPGLVAYFCAEYGLHQTFNQYSGGLGILAGDHVKEASDKGLPLVAVGLLYRRGFFRQSIDRDGRQEHGYGRFADDNSPVERVLGPDGQPLTLAIPFPGRTVAAAVWRAQVGRVPVLLLDTDLEENGPEDRPITSQLYTAGRSMRLHQEWVLGFGGAEALRQLDVVPSVWHLNEGHSAFLIAHRLQTESAKQVQAKSVLTIHTPVPAGNERFAAADVAPFLATVLPKAKAEAMLKAGLDLDADASVFDMTACALRHSRAANGVSLLHGKTADETWRAVAGFPLTGVTNGVHMPTWLGPEMQALFTSAGARFDQETRLETAPDPHGRPLWTTAEKLDPSDLWNAHLAQKARMIEFVQPRLFEQFSRHGEGPAELAATGSLIDPSALVIGFARRFATYKRALLLFSDERRLLKLLGDPDRPVQIVFAGKAHPADRAGQAFIAKVWKKTRSKRFKGRVFLVEEYDMEVGARLVQGVDIWLNNPRRPLEASGTSGMKAAANGVPNLSVLDGWWDEAFVDGPIRNGWAIGDRKPRPEAEQDLADAESLYRVLEREVVPAYFDRDQDGVPVAWTRIMAWSIETSVAAFSTSRMLDDYAATMYRDPA